MRREERLALGGGLGDVYAVAAEDLDDVWPANGGAAATGRVEVAVLNGGHPLGTVVSLARVGLENDCPRRDGLAAKFDLAGYVKSRRAVVAAAQNAHAKHKNTQGSPRSIGHWMGHGSR